MKSIDKWDYKDEAVLSLMIKHLYDTEFMGIKGTIKFDDNGDVFGDIKYEQLFGEFCL